MESSGHNEGLVGSDKAVRNRTFDELSIEQKIEALRREARMLREMVEMQSNLIATLMRHEHKGDGSMLVPINTHGGMQGEARGYRHDPLR